ncbi:ABC transporter substrate-binding protein [Cellulomonas sp. P5_E12]
MVSKMFRTRSIAAGIAVLALGLAACGGGGDDAGDGATTGSSGDSGGDAITVGFSQVGSESGWRAANTKSIQETLTAENGFDLSFSDAQQKQENQIQAIRSYIAQGVDYIAFSPVVESGWDGVLEEAKDAGIPVILTDRAVDSKDTSLYKTFIGSDFVKEGERVGEWVSENLGTEPINVVELQGTTGSAPANDRKSGFADAIKGNPNVKVIASETGNFTRAEGKTVMEGFLQAYPDIDVVYAHNDDMGLGAIEAIEAAGKVPGKDIKIVSIDGVHDGMVALSEGKISYIVECNPLLGPDLADIIKTLNDGGTVEPRIVTEDDAFTQEQAIAALPDRQY